MRRGDVVTVAVAGDFGKPRPAVIVQSDVLNPSHASFLVCLMTSDVQEVPSLRIDVALSEENGLRRPSQVMIDKIQTVRREKIGPVTGRLGPETLSAIDRSLAVVLGLA